MTERHDGRTTPAAHPIRYGVIGTGMMGVEHIHNIRAMPDAEVVAISDPTESSRAAGLEAATGDGPGPAARIGDLAVVADHRALLDHPDLDAVVVVSPNHTHRDIMTDVLAAGVHVLVEKPLCTTVADCLDVITTAEATAGPFPDRVIQVGLEYRYMPAVARLIDEVASGVIGRPRMVAIREHRFPFLAKVGHWNRFSANTGGTLVEKCCHFFDLMNLIVGERPTRVMASGAQDVNHLDEVYDGRPVRHPRQRLRHRRLPRRGQGHARPLHVRRRQPQPGGDLGGRGRRQGRGPPPRGGSGSASGAEHWIGDVPGEMVDDSHIAYGRACTTARATSSTSTSRPPSAVNGRCRSPWTTGCGRWPWGWPPTARSTRAARSDLDEVLGEYRPPARRPRRRTPRRGT